MRLAVRTLEDALELTDIGDPVTTSRLAAALSMAAGRLRDAENSQPDKASASSGEPEGENDAMREQMADMLMRLTGEEEGEDGMDTAPDNSV